MAKRDLSLTERDQEEALRHRLPCSRSWGPPELLVEVVLPIAPKFSQIDMMLAFSDRLVIGEVKMRPASHLNVLETYEQVDGRFDEIRRVESAAGFDSESILPIMLLPKLGDADVKNARRQVVYEAGGSHVHVFNAGLGPNTLATRLDRGLRRRTSSRLVNGVGLQEWVRALIQEQLIPCGDLAEAIDRVRLQPPAPSSLIHRARWYDPTFRAKEREAALKRLEREGILEVAGAPGAGRRTLAEEAVGQYRWQRGFPSVVLPLLRKIQSEDQLCEVAFTRAHEAAENLNAEERFARLMGTAAAFTILDYDGPSQTAIRGFLDHVQQFRREIPDRSKSVWVIRSVAPIAEHLGCTLRLGAVSDTALFRLLRRAGPPP